MQGIVVVNKEKGWTSFDVVKKIKKIWGIKKVGHLGTLDPMAEGVLPVAIGKATKLFDYYLKKSKTYIAQFEFGYETDTLDAEGQVIKTTSNLPSKKDIEEVLSSFVGKLQQTPPKYSAVKINGQRAYALARDNKEFQIQPKQIEIYKLEVLGQTDTNTYEFLIECSAGTYIRSLCQDIAKRLNSLATMTKLTRTRSGNFTQKDAKTIEELEQNKTLISTSDALNHLPKIELDEKYFQKLSNGVEVKIINQPQNVLSTIFVGDRLFGIGEVEKGILKISTRLNEGENI